MRRTARVQCAAPEPWKSNAQRSALQALQIVEFRAQIFGVGEQAECPAIDYFTPGSQLASMTDAVEQRQADFVLQLLYRLAYRRLCREHDPGGLGKAALLHHFNKNVESP